jgi:site-specific recombinase XerC
MAAAAELEATRIRGGLIDPRDIAYRDHAARPISEHILEWHRDMLAKGKTAKHADQYRDRAGKVMALASGTSICALELGRSVQALERTAAALDDALSHAHFGGLSSESIQSALATLSDFGKSNQTVNHYRAALRAFLIWCKERGRTRDNPMTGVGALNVDEDQRHIRRALTDDELARLIRSAETGPIRFEMSGPLRAMAYKVAASAGLRVEELRTLNPESFRLDTPDPSIFLRASSTKNRKPADQPIPQALARELREWLRGKPPGESVFPLHHETAKAIRGDLEAIGIPYETDDGVADFHSLRAYYVSALVRSGASIAEVRKLARHAKPETTLKHYAKVAPHDLRGAVEALPAQTTNDEDRQTNAQAATGTDGRTHKQTLAHYLPTAGDGSVRLYSVPDVMMGSESQTLTEPGTLENAA